MSYSSFEQKMLKAERVNPDRTEGFQCVDLIKQYLRDEFSIPLIPVASAKNYWEGTPEKILEKFDKLPIDNVRPGDIVPLRGLFGNDHGHVGIATGKTTASAVEILEQNGSTGNGKGEGKDRIRKRFVPKDRLYGVLRAKPAPASTPGGNHPYAWAVGRTVYLKPHVSSWRVYAAGSRPPRNHVAILNPKRFGGLSYQILRTDVSPNSVVIRTQMFGEVSLPIDHDAEIR